MAYQAPCRYFLLGICKEGDNCKFSHAINPRIKHQADEQSTVEIAGPQNERLHSHDHTNTGRQKDNSYQQHNASEAKFKAWRYSIPIDPKKARKLGPSLSRFLQEALLLLDGEIGQVQEVITLMASEGGMLRVAEILDQPFTD